MFSVRIVDADFYVTKPMKELDILYSGFRKDYVTHVPVIRVFGSTPNGQKTCLHIHQVFPYIYVPYDGTEPKDKYLGQLATSIDFAVQISLGKATSATKHVYKCEIVKCIPFYGYHEGEQEFVKIQFYNPRIVVKVVDLLQNGAIFSKVFQPYEAHIPYLLQFLIDFNLYGMNFLHARKVFFRGFSTFDVSMENKSSFHISLTPSQQWNENTIPSELRLGSNITRNSQCELEVDVNADDILNQLEIQASIGRNPGIAAMWEDEKQRQRDHGQPSQISLPVSQERGEMQLLDSEKAFRTRIREIILERNQVIQSQLDVMEKSLSPVEFQKLSQSILLEGKEPCGKPTTISQDIDESLPIIDESVIEDVLKASQSQSNSLCGQIDDELVAMVLSIAEDPNISEPPEFSPKANTSQEITCKETEESDNEDEESIIMSQPVWDDLSLLDDCENDLRSDYDNEDWKPQRIPQLDGPADDDTPLSGNSNSSRLPQAREKEKHREKKHVKSDDENDFQIKKKRKVSGKRILNNHQEKGKPKTSRRKAIGRLEVVSGSFRKRSKSTSGGGTNTNVGLSLVKSGKSDWDDTEFPNLDSFHLPSKSLKDDQGSLDSIKVKKRQSLVSKIEVCSKNSTSLSKKIELSSAIEDSDKLTSVISSCHLQHVETDSSGSQNSGFELHLTESSSDGEDFESYKRIPRVTSSHKLESFHVAKQFSVTPALSEDDVSKRDLRRAGATETIFPFQYRKLKNGKASKISDRLSKAKMSHKIRNSSVVEVRRVKGNNSRNMRHVVNKSTNISKNAKSKAKKGNQGNVSENLGNRDTINGNRVQRSKVFLDAYVRLEKITINDLKSSSANFLRHSLPEHSSSQNVRGSLESKIKCDNQNSPKDGGSFVSRCSDVKDNTLEDCLMDEGRDSLYQMAMLSPRPVASSAESPPLPSSPSPTFVDFTLDKTIFPGKDRGLEKEESLNKDFSKPHSHMSSMRQTERAKQFNKISLTENSDVDGANRFYTIPGAVPIKFVGDEHVKNIVFPFGLCNKEIVRKDISTTDGDYSCDEVDDLLGSDLDTGVIEVGVHESADVISGENTTLRDSLSTDDEVGSCMDMGKEAQSCSDIDTLSPVTSKVRDLFGIHENVKSDMDNNKEVEACGNINIISSVSPDLLNVTGNCDEDGSSVDMQEQNGTKQQDVDSASPGVSVVCDSFSSDGNKSGLNVEKMLKDIELSRESFGKIDIDIENVAYDESDEHSQMRMTLNDCKVWKPAVEAPSSSYISETRRLYGLPSQRHQKVFCSDPKDIPSVARVVGGRRLQVNSLSTDGLDEFDLGGNFQTLQEFQSKTANDLDHSLLRDCLQSIDVESCNEGYIGILSKVKPALMEDHMVIITPVNLPPSSLAVREWMKARKACTQLDPKVIDHKNNTNEIGHSKSIEYSQMDCKTNCQSSHITVSKVLRELKVSDIPRDKTSQDDKTDSQVSTESDVNESRDTVNLDLRELSQGVPETFSRDLVSGPQHSTPVGDHGIKIRKFWQSTPKDEKCLKEDLEKEISSEEKPCKIKNLRRNILYSQIKDHSCEEQRPSPCEASYIEGPTPTNSFGFQISQPNIQEAKSVRQVQFLTLLSVELHVRTRKDLRPDPEFDAVCAIFYHIEHETTQGKKYTTGIIVVRNESTKLKNFSAANVSTSTGSPSLAQAKSFEDSLLHHTGISTNLKVTTEYREIDAINSLIKLVQEWDPDILMGFEVQMLSWGYLIQRAGFLGIEVVQQLSRIQDMSGTAQFDADKDQWGASHTSEISISGRIVLNVWRLMRHEVTLNVYSFENISYHILRERIPLYTYRQLTRWWDYKLPHDRWRTVEHYVIRCQGNIKILNHVDFINRTSEFARLYGILFYSVISRGSQFRVESMMLRLAKPMNYLAVSPSIQQRARMDAPECIPLVMEPESRFYSDPVIVLDFQSLYPSMMIAYNYCFSTCLGRISRLHKIGDFNFGCTTLNVPPALLEKLEGDIHISANGSAFVKSTIRKGILPRMVEEILDTRVMVKRAMKEHKNDKILGKLLDARQLGLKLIANVTYGYTSANFSGRMPSVEIADAIVRKARETLERAIHMVNSREEWGARVVYGDTDSLFVLVKGVTKEEAFRIGKDIVDAVTADNPKPVKLKFEKNTTLLGVENTLLTSTHRVVDFKLYYLSLKYNRHNADLRYVPGCQAILQLDYTLWQKVYLPCVLQTKKRYVGYMYETLEQQRPIFDAKGIETVRRDNCPAVGKLMIDVDLWKRTSTGVNSQILEKSLRILFEEKDVSLVKRFVQRQFRKLMEERVSIQDFVFAKEYRGMKAYKPTACVPALELARRELSRDRRAEPRVGERVPYVIVNGSPGSPLIQLVRRPRDLLEDASLRLNSCYYINKQILPPLNRVFSLIGVDVYTWFSELPRYAPRHRIDNGKQKSSISRFFTTLHCPVCEQLTQQGLCRGCRRNPQKAVIMLTERMGNWERKYHHLNEICFHCCGTRDEKISCMSLDCPVMFKRIKMGRKLECGEMLRDVQRRIQTSYS